MRRTWLGVAVILGALTIVGISPALAQVDQVVVKVPFSFVVGRTSLPAGTYRVIANSGNLDAMTVTNLNGLGEATILTDWVAPLPAENDSALVFKKVDGQYYLSAIRIPGQDTREVVLPEPPEGASHHHES